MTLSLVRTRTIYSGSSGWTASDTLYELIRYNNEKKALQLQTDLKIPEPRSVTCVFVLALFLSGLNLPLAFMCRYCHLKIRGLVKSHNWDALFKFGNEKKLPVSHKVQTCLCCAASHRFAHALYRASTLSTLAWLRTHDWKQRSMCRDWPSRMKRLTTISS